MYIGTSANLKRKATLPITLMRELHEKQRCEKHTGSCSINVHVCSTITIQILQKCQEIKLMNIAIELPYVVLLPSTHPISVSSSSVIHI